MPTIETTIHLLCVPITSDTNYSYDVMGLTQGKTYYVRAYAKNQVGVAYSFNQMTFIAAEIDDSNFINLPAAGIAVQKNDVVSFIMRWDEANRLCNDSAVSGLTDWRLPTIEELSIMYANKDYIGGFVTYGQAYWSSYEGNANGTLYHLTKHFGSGDEGRASSQYAGYARCVRTLTK